MIVATGDCHLAPTIWSGKPGLKDDAYHSFMQVIDYCIENADAVDCLMLVGDILDSNEPNSRSVVFFIHQMNRMMERGIPVYAIQGQHDRSEPPWTEVHDHVVYVGDGKEFSIDCDGETVSVAGFDCMPAPALRDCLKESTAELILLHQMHKSAIGFEGAWNFDPMWLPETVCLVLMGDYHLGGSFDICHYTGSTHMRAIDQAKDKHFLTVTAEDSEFDIARQPLVTRDVLDFLIDSDEALEEMFKQLSEYTFDKPEPITSPVVAAYISPDVEKSRERIDAGLEELPHAVHLLPYVATGSTAEKLLPRAEMKNVTLPACLSQMVDPEKDEELHSFVLSLLESNDPSVTLAEQKKRLGVT